MIQKRRRRLLIVWSPRQMDPISFHCFQFDEHEHPMTEAVIVILLCAVANMDLKFDVGRLRIEREFQE